MSQTNGSLNLHIPLWSVKQRGNLKLEYWLAYAPPTYTLDFDCDSDVGHPVPTDCHSTYPVCPDYQFAQLCSATWRLDSGLPGEYTIGPYIASSIDYKVRLQTIFATYGSPPMTSEAGFYFEVVDPNRAAHRLLRTAGTQWRAVDASGFLYDTSTCTLRDSQANVYQFGCSSTQKYGSIAGDLQSVTDANGNQIAYQPTGNAYRPLIDSRGVTIPAASGVDVDSACPSDSKQEVKWFPLGVSSPIVLCYGNTPYRTWFFSGNAYPDTNHGNETNFEAVGDWWQVTRMVMPTGETYGFEYQNSSTGGPSNYIELSKLTLPTGGFITYRWQEDTSVCGVLRAGSAMTTGVRERDVYESTTASPATWTYSYTTYGQQRGGGVTDPLGNTTTFDLVYPPLPANGGASCGGYPHTTQYKNAAGDLQKSITTNYQWYPSAILTSAANVNDPLTLEGLPLTTTESWADGRTKQTTFSYDAGFSAHTIDGGTATIPYGKLLSKTEYLSGTSSAGPAVLKTETAYKALGDAGYLNNNFLELPASTQVSDLVSGSVRKTTYAYDSATLGHLTSSKQHLDSSGADLETTYTYTPYGLLNIQTLPADPSIPASTTTRTYASTYGGAVPTSIKDPMNHETTITYDASSLRVTAVKDPNTNSTTYEYYGDGRLKKISYADGGQRLYSYPSANEVDESIALNASQSMVMQSFFDGLGRKVKTVQKGTCSGNDTVVETTYDLLERVRSTSNPFCSNQARSSIQWTYYGNADGTQAGYDSLGRPIRLTNPDGTTRTWSYNNRSIDSVQDSVTTTDEAEHSTSQVMDALGHLVGVVEPGGIRTAYSVNAFGETTGVSQTGVASETARQRGFQYDSLGRLTSATNPESGTVGYGYDNHNNVTTKTDARGKTISYTYDALNRITYKSASDNSLASQYTYDQVWTGWGMPHSNTIGRLMRAQSCNSNGCNDDTFSYDSMGRIDHIESASPSEAGQAHVVASQYDLAGNETQTYYGHRDNGDLGGITIGRTYDSAGRLASVFQKARNGIPLSTPYNLVSSVTYLPNGSPNIINYGNGITETISQNSRQQVCESGVDDSVTTFLRRRYFYNSTTSSGDACNTSMSGNNGNIWHVVDATNPAVLGPYTQDFGYDSLNRVTSWTAQYATGGPRTQAFNYDSFGNLQQTKGYSQYPQQTGTPNARLFANPGWTNASDWPYDTKNRLRSGTFDCTTAQAGDPSHPWYDLAGNVLCGGSNSDMNGQQYLWDAESRIAQLNAEHNNNAYTKQATYVYDGEGNRVNATQYDAGGNPVSFRDSIRYQGSILWDENGGPGMSNTWNDYVYAFGKRIARLDASAPVLHLRGMRDTGVAAWGVEGPVNGLATNIVGKVIQPGDLLVIDERQDMVTYGGLTLFTHDPYGNVICVCEAADTVTLAPTFFNSFGDGRWHHFSADLSAHAGETIYYVVAGIHNSAPPTGTFDLRLANAVLMHADGSVDPLFSPSTTVTNFQPNYYGGAAALSSGVSPDSVQGASASSPGTVSIRFTNDANDNGDRNLFITGLTSGGQAVDLSGATYTGCHDGSGIYCGGSMTVTVPNSETLQISAYGSLSNGAGPHMLVYFNGVLAAQWDVSNTVATYTMQPPIVPDPMGVTYYVGDQVGTAQMEFSAFGGPKWKGEFAPFGQELDTQPTDNRYKFTGKERDQESGLDYFGARYYGSNMGRWMSPDWSPIPIAVPYANLGDPQSLNLYQYVRNNPLSQADVDGHRWWNKLGNIFTDAQCWCEGAEAANRRDENRKRWAAEDRARQRMIQNNPWIRTMISVTQSIALGQAVGSVSDVGVDPISQPETIIEETWEYPEVVVDSSKYPESAQHISDAQEAGQPSLVTIDRAGAATRRGAALKNVQGSPGMDRDEYPPAFSREGGAGASTRVIPRSDNRGSGAAMGNQIRNLPDGSKVRITPK